MFIAVLEALYPSSLNGANSQFGVGVPGERAEPARDVHDSRASGLAQKWEHGLGYGERAEKVGVHYATHDAEIDHTGRRVAGGVDARIVDQHVEPLEIGRDSCSRCFDRRGHKKVECDETSAEILRLELCGCGLAEAGVASAEQDRHARDSQASRNLKPDTFVCAGDERYPL